MTTSREIRLKSRPAGAPTADNFELATVTLPDPAAGEIQVRNSWMTVDPYMRGRMNDVQSYVPPFQIGEALQGGAVGEVTASNDPAFKVGDAVQSFFGWREAFNAPAAAVQKLDTHGLPPQAFLGVAGMPGMTAWYGFTQIMQPKQGETIVVSAASGAVGSVVGQLAKLRGCRAVGIAGGAEKCAYVVNELGFDACIDYKAGNLEADLAAATPNGIDAVFENVGGAIFDACLARMNPFGRIALCGLISGYDGKPMPLNNVRVLLTMRLTMRGFIVSEHMDLWPQGLTELGTLVATGKLKFRESIAQGLTAAPDAFLGLL